jgi:hypothetical protein
MPHTEEWVWVYSDAECTRPIALESPDRDVLLISEDAIGPRAYVTDDDARLIVAAPDLLAACEAIARSEAVMPYGLAKRLNEVIAMAKGGES